MHDGRMGDWGGKLLTQFMNAVALPTYRIESSGGRGESQLTIRFLRQNKKRLKYVWNSQLR